LGKLPIILALIVVVLGVVAYFCPSLAQNTQTGNLDIWGRNVWEKGAVPPSSETMSIVGYPYRLPGEILMIAGLTLLCGTLLYPRVRKEQYLPSTK
jgi:drug/metabolite transporter (DMT)-like permease